MKRKNSEPIRSISISPTIPRTAYLGVQITPVEVATMMVLLKIARTRTGAPNIDCWVDAAGYAALAGEIANVQNPPA